MSWLVNSLWEYVVIALFIVFTFALYYYLYRWIFIDEDVKEWKKN